MSIAYLNKAFRDKDSKGNERLILISLADSANDDGWAWPGQKALSSKSNISRVTAIKYLTALHDANRITIFQRSRPGGKGWTSNAYRLDCLGAKQEFPEDLSGLLKEKPRTPVKHVEQGGVKHVEHLDPPIEPKDDPSKRTPAPSGADAEDRDPMFDIVAELIFQVNLTDFEGNAGRIAQISNWLNGKNGGASRGIGKLMVSQTPDDVRQFVKWWGSQKGRLNLPHSIEKFSGHYLAFMAWRAKHAQPTKGQPSVEDRQAAADLQQTIRKGKK